MTDTSITAPIAWPHPQRRAAFEQWLAPLAVAHGLEVPSLRPASADASFRRYLRLDGAGGGAGSGGGSGAGDGADNGAGRGVHRSFIVMDAPPPQEDVRPFVHIAGLIHGAGLHAPEVLAQDVEHGFLLLSDLGSRLYLDALREASAAQADALMRDAIGALVQWQLRVKADTLPRYDDALFRRELALFPDWCVAHEFKLEWSLAQRASWERVCTLLVQSALAQPTVAVHRDWMPRNLMVAEPNPGILDFQDAVRGPLSYDVASLLRDAFISWEEEREIDWAARYWDAARQAALPVPEDFGEFWRQLEWMGLQRHLKVLGIFCRLKHRDGKPKYTQDLPRFFAYATKVALRYRELQPLLALIEPISGLTRQSAYSMR